LDARRRAVSTRLVDPSQAPVAVAVGAVVGFLGGMFGKGGSAIATPFLHAAGVPALAALASPLPATIPATLVAARGYRRLDLVDTRLLAWTVGVGVPATVAGGLASRLVGGGALVTVTEVVLLGLGASLATGRAGPAERATPLGRREAGRARMALVAAVAGAAAGLLANAGGFLLAPLFVTVLRRPLKVAFGTSLAASAVLAVPGTLVHAALGHVDWTLAALFAAASIPLSGLGARVGLRTRADRLERRYGAFLVATAAVLLLGGR
jgi:uncharacterized membrane protein YfcA